ncbi:MAG TPA: glucose-6-phosphate dehydrogenase [Oligoflexia bacterium]|nr:glucose-6-phosphate dehydrogenase [Oligoflexia bacterium]HMP47476.1 glucose-6-phosphate dehydrogenase [Oligoflexia bacterium]
MQNPFRSSVSESAQVGPCIVVIFGATGDLTHRKLVPALYNLSVDGLLPANFHTIGVARRDMPAEKFREGLGKAIRDFSRRKEINESVWSELSTHTHYVNCPFDSLEHYTGLREKIESLEMESGMKANRLFYLATSPDYFEVISHNLAASGLLDQSNGVAARVIVEKPFGHDLATAKELNTRLLGCMKEEQIFRIDHYLGKETVQNLLVFRFSNGFFEPIWNYKYIDHVEISVCESIGVGGRAGYFDSSGILRDIVQNHALQLLCLVGLEPPVAFEADAVRDEKVKVLRSVRRIPIDRVSGSVVRGRYQSGAVDGKEVPGYLAEAGVDPASTTETYVALQFAIDNWRWAGVPFFVRAGKRVAKRVTEISVHFKKVPHLLFRDQSSGSWSSNVLSFRIQPDEGISFKISAKPPGPKVQVQSVNMDFSYGSSFGIEAPEAYERLLLDAMKGDATLFTRNDEIEQAWDLLENVFAAWRGDHGISPPPVYGYEAGSWGPNAAEELLVKKIGQGWRRL